MAQTQSSHKINWCFVFSNPSIIITAAYPLQSYFNIHSKLSGNVNVPSTSQHQIWEGWSAEVRSVHFSSLAEQIVEKENMKHEQMHACWNNSKEMVKIHIILS